MLGGAIADPASGADRVALRHLATGVVGSYALATPGSFGLFQMTDPAGERWSADATALFIPAGPGPATDLAVAPSGVVLSAPPGGRRGPAGLTVVPRLGAGGSRPVVVLGFSGHDVVGVGGVEKGQACHLYALGSGDQAPEQWRSTAVLRPHTACWADGSTGAVAPNGRSAGLWAGRGSGGRWSLINVLDGTLATATAVAGGWVPGAPWRAGQPLTKGRAAAYELMDGAGQVVVETDPALGVEKIQLARWFLDERG